MFDNNFKISILELMNEEFKRKNNYWQAQDDQEDIQEFVEGQGGGEVELD